MSSPAEAVASLVQEINVGAEGFLRADSDKEAFRSQLILAAKEIVANLTNPTDIIFQHAYEGAERVCVRLAIDLRIFHHLAKCGEQGMTATELAKACGSEQLLVVRIMRVLTAMKYATEISQEIYGSTQITKALTSPAIEAALKHMFDFSLKVTTDVPRFFETKGYQCPVDSKNCPWQFTFNTELPMFDYLQQYPQAAKNFNIFMTGSRSARLFWADWFPVQEVLLDGYEESEEGVLLVDVGGGLGHDVRHFREKFPAVRGRLVLQDLPHTIDQAQHLNEGIQLMSHNFFDPQPIHGARIYFFHFVLSDWPDETCVKILRHIASAMTPGYSKLILNETVLPDTDCQLFQACTDISMMAVLAAAMRPQRHFQQILDAAGLEIMKVWFPPSNTEAVIEAMRKA